MNTSGKKLDSRAKTIHLSIDRAAQILKRFKPSSVSKDMALLTSGGEVILGYITLKANGTMVTAVGYPWLLDTFIK